MVEDGLSVHHLGSAVIWASNQAARNLERAGALHSFPHPISRGFIGSRETTRVGRVSLCGSRARCVLAPGCGGIFCFASYEPKAHLRTGIGPRECGSGGISRSFLRTFSVSAVDVSTSPNHADAGSASPGVAVLSDWPGWPTESSLACHFSLLDLSLYRQQLDRGLVRLCIRLSQSLHHAGFCNWWRVLHKFHLCDCDSYFGVECAEEGSRWLGRLGVAVTPWNCPRLPSDLFSRLSLLRRVCAAIVEPLDCRANYRAYSHCSALRDSPCLLP